MNKEEYLKIIQKETKKINTDEKEDILSKYESYFINGYQLRYKVLHSIFRTIQIQL